MVSPMIAAKAYAAMQSQATGAAGGAASAGGVGGPGFADMLKSAMNETLQASRTAEIKMAEHTQGKAELVDVVTAVASAQASLETVMAVRDQVISAYQEIMRMPI